MNDMNNKYPLHIPTLTHQVREDDEGTDYGDELTPEQIAAAQKMEDEGNLSDEEVAAALKAMKKGDGDDDPKDDDPKDNKDDKGDDDPKDKIPKKRFDEAVGKERKRADAAENALAELKRKNKKPETKPKKTYTDLINEVAEEVNDLRKDWQKAMLNNDEAAATNALESMTEAETELNQLRLDQASSTTRQQTNEDVSYANALRNLEVEFPQIDEKSEDFDKELLAKMARLHTGLMNGGQDIVSALEEAAEVYLSPFKKDKKETIADTLRKSAKKTLAETIKDQPPDGGKLGTDHLDTKDVVLKPSRMTRKQFDKLDESQLSVLRGDKLA